MNVRWRLGLAIIQFGLLVVASWLASGVAFSLETWFLSGALGVVLATQVSEPFYSKPSDVLVNGVGVALLVLTSGFPVWPGAWQALIAYAALGILAALAAQLASRGLGVTSGFDWGARGFRLLPLFSGRVLFSAVFLIAALARFEGELGHGLVVIAAWAAVLITSGIRWDEVLRGKRADSRPFHARQIVAPSRLVLEGPQLGFSLGDPVMVSGNRLDPIAAHLVRRAPSGRNMARYEIHFAVPRDAERLLGLDLVLSTRLEKARAVGVIVPGTSDDLLLFDTMSPVSIGDPVLSTSTSGGPVLYQVSGMRVVSEVTGVGAVAEYVRAEAVQVGAIGVGDSVDPSREIAAPGSLVTQFLRTGPPAQAPTASSVEIGPIAQTGISVWLDPEVLTRGHTAILGMTGMGKSTFARRLATELAKECPVVVVDQTGEYRAMGLPPTSTATTSAPGLSLRDLDSSPKPHADALVALQELERLGRQEVQAGTAPMRRVLILEEAHQFVPEPSMLGFNIPGREESIKFGLLMMQVRKFGVSVILVSQRTAVVAKSALSQCENIIAFKSVDHTGLDYLEAFGGSTARELLPRLSCGRGTCAGLRHVCSSTGRYRDLAPVANQFADRQARSREQEHEWSDLHGVTDGRDKSHGRAATTDRMCGVRQDAGDLPADLGHPGIGRRGSAQHRGVYIHGEGRRRAERTHLRDRAAGARRHPGSCGNVRRYYARILPEPPANLRAEAFKYGVLTEVTQRLLIDRNSTQSGLTTCTKVVGGETQTLRRFTDSRLYAQVLSILQEDAVDMSLVPDAVDTSLKSYLTLIAERNLFDYTTMVATAVELLESDDEADPSTAALLSHVRGDIRYVVVDEYQDVNPLQERLIAGIVRYGANLCVVGDDDQTIYQWRGSEVSNILKIGSTHEDVVQITLAENFRSSQGVVALGRAVAERLPSEERLAKEMKYASHQQWARGDLLALQFDDLESEAEWIADRIVQLSGTPFIDRADSDARGMSWSDMAVLFRTVKDADALVAALRARKVPYIIKGLARLFDAPEIQALVSMFRYMTGTVSRQRGRRLLAGCGPSARGQDGRARPTPAR